jgi:4-carboxymuconolactone decarboxylase
VIKPTHISTDKSVTSARAPYEGNPKEFDGDVTLLRLVWAEDSQEVELLAVWFSAGARTKPHIHDVDQVLLVMAGKCAYGDEDGVTIVEAGHVFTIPAKTWHWHGATLDEPMMHISIRKQGNSTNWEVDEKEWRAHYKNLKK